MSELEWFLLGHVVCVTQWAAFIWVDYAYLGVGRLKHPLVWGAVLTACEMAISTGFHIDFFSSQSIFINVVFVLLSTLLFGGSLSQKLTAGLINGTMCLLEENAVRYVASWALQTSLLTVWHRAECLVAMVITNLIVGAVVAHFSRQWKDERALESPQALVMSFFPAIVVVLNTVLMVSANDAPATPMMLVLTLGLTVAVLVHMAIVQMFNKQMVQQQELHVQAALEQERAEALMESYTTQRRLTHEFTNHLDALNLLLQQGDTEGAIAYLNTVSKTVQTSTTVLNSHNPLLDALLSKKYEEASRQGIMVYFDLSDLREIPLRRIELVTVVSNLMNNAIEAAAKSDQPEVHFRMYKADGELLLSVRNRVAEDVPLADGQLPRSTKHEPGHGMGLYNVQETIRRCGGESTISCRDHWFRVTCSVPCNS